MTFSPCSPYDELEKTRALLNRFGWNTTSYQILNKGISRWFSSDGEAVIGFVERNGVWVVAGAPVCAEIRLPEVIAGWETQAKSANKSVCYFGAEERLLRASATLPDHCRVVLGAQPVWNPQRWNKQVLCHASFRAQLSRAKGKKLVIAEWPYQVAQDNPQLWKLLKEWLAHKGLPPMHFLVEPETLDNLVGRRIFVASLGTEPVAFLVASPIPERKGWLTEQFVRGDKAPNGAIESLVNAAVQAMAADGYQFVTMGIVPLSLHSHPQASCNPDWMQWLLKWVRAHGRRFYNFDGLDRFKSKFQPEAWEPIYAISNEPAFSFKTLYAVSAAFSDGHPLSSLGRAMVRAISQEISWLFAKKSESKAGIRTT